MVENSEGQQHRRSGEKLHWDPACAEQVLTFEGHLGMQLEKNFGAEFRPLGSWQETLPMAAGQPLELWLEYAAEGTAALELIVREYRAGSVDTLVHTWKVAGEKMQQPFVVRDDSGAGDLSFSLRARGEGNVRIGALHVRPSLEGAGSFLPGGERQVTSDRQEVFSYYEPGDGRSPLCVYFSGYRTAEGFEGLSLMRSMGAPFLLLSDPRLEGGAFYLGTPEYEQLILDRIRRAMADLSFSPDQLVLSGMAMGSVGALYYGASLGPRAVIAGRPIPNVGSVAMNERLLRPGGFPASLDVLRFLTGGITPDNAAALDRKVWERIDKADWSHSEIALAYMREDDYDPEGYPDLLRHLRGQKVRIYGKGIEGRHNDNTEAVMDWFREQYRRILQEDFGRQE